MGLLSKEIIVHCPIEGKVSPLEYCPDEVFSKGMTGKGVVIFPTGDTVYAPMDGKVEFIFESKHALAIKSQGIEYLIHVGLDIFVKASDEVKQGDILIEMNSGSKDRRYSCQCPNCNKTLFRK